MDRVGPNGEDAVVGVVAAGVTGADGRDALELPPMYDVVDDRSEGRVSPK